MMIEQKYFIFDCDNNIVGNPKGYKTFRGANIQANGNTKLRWAIWDKYENRQNKASKLVNSIELCDILVQKSYQL
jgi:hypothetical protein